MSSHSSSCRGPVSDVPVIKVFASKQLYSDYCALNRLHLFMGTKRGRVSRSAPHIVLHKVETSRSASYLIGAKKCELSDWWLWNCMFQELEKPHIARSLVCGGCVHVLLRFSMPCCCIGNIIHRDRERLQDTHRPDQSVDLESPCICSWDRKPVCLPCCCRSIPASPHAS